MRLRRNAGRRRSAAGYVLLESVMALVVASVGFIGAARMQTLGLTLGNSAQSRQKATLLVYQMADRLRANQAGVAAHAYDNATTGATTCLDDGDGCTPVELAAADVGRWQQDINAQLPSGSGRLCIDSTPEDGTAAVPACDGIGNVLAVKVWWTDKVATTRFVTVIRP